MTDYANDCLALLADYVLSEKVKTPDAAKRRDMRRELLRRMGVSIADAPRDPLSLGTKEATE